MRTARTRLAEAQDLGVETCGRIAQFWGFTRSMGRAFGLLYLSPQPLSQADVQKRLRVSAGNASMTLAALVRWGVVHKVNRPKERRDRYTAETDFWKMISGVLNERERREIKNAVATVERARGHARAARKAAAAAARKDAVFVSERLNRLLDVCVLGETILDTLLGDLKLDIGAFRGILRS